MTQLQALLARATRRSSPALLLALATALAGCGDGGSANHDRAPGSAAEEHDQEPTPSGPAEERTGSLSLALTTQAGVSFDSFSYAITGPSFTKPGRIDVANSTTVSALIDGIPVATGYSITISGDSAVAEGGTTTATCSGSASFDIAAGVVTQVPVAIACHLAGDEPPAAAAPVPLPPAAPLALGLLLLAAGSVAVGKRRQRAVA